MRDQPYVAQQDEKMKSAQVLKNGYTLMDTLPEMSLNDHCTLI